jgi:nucleotide-binding universal stress UspA family protein
VLIIGFTRKHDIDLMAMTTHSTSGLKRAIIENVADEEVVDKSEKPVLVFNPDPRQ